MSDNPKKTAVLGRVDADLARTVHNTAARLSMSISDYVGVCLARGVLHDAEAVSLSNAAHSDEIARLSRLAADLTRESSGGRRGVHDA